MKLKRDLCSLGCEDVEASFSEISAEYNEEEIANIPVDLDDTAEIYDLIESNEEPYFNHISDALKVIDFYEVNECTRTSEYLEVDQMERRSSLPEDILV